MKRIETQETKDKRQRRTKIIVGAILIFLMTFSTAGFALYGHGGGSSYDNTADLNDGTHTGPYYNGQYWVHTSFGQQYYLTHSVDEITDIPVEITKTPSDFQVQTLFVAAQDELVTNEIAVNIGRYAQRAQRACFGSCEEDLPEKDCTEPLIVYTESDEQHVYEEENCVFIEGNLASVDAFLYTLFSL